MSPGNIFWLTIFFQFFATSKSDFTTKIRLNSDALDSLICPLTLQTVNNRLNSNSILSWKGVSDESISKINIGIPPGDIHCRYELDPSRNSVRIFLDSSLSGSPDFKIGITLEIVWENGVQADCNATVDGDEKMKTIFDGMFNKESVCKEIKDYFVQTPSTVVYPIWADLNLVYTVSSVVIEEKYIDFGLNTVLEPPNSIFSPKSIQIPSGNESIKFSFDQNVINAIFEALYEKYGDQIYRLGSGEVPDLRLDCGNGNFSQDTRSCLGSHLKSVFNLEKGGTELGIRFESTPRIKIDPNSVTLRSTGWMTLNQVSDSSNTTLMKFSYRLIAGLNATVSSDRKIKAMTSLSEIALMTSDFEISGIQAQSERFNATTKQVLMSLAPILIDLMKEWLGVGLPIPVPQSMKLVGAKFWPGEEGFDVKGDVSV